MGKNTIKYDWLIIVPFIAVFLFLLLIIGIIFIASIARPENNQQEKNYVLNQIDGYTLMQSLVLSFEEGISYNDIESMLANYEEISCEYHVGIEGDLGVIKSENEYMELHFYDRRLIQYVDYHFKNSVYRYCLLPEDAQGINLRVNGNKIELYDRYEVFNYLNSLNQ